MTYKELADLIARLDEKDLNCDATVAIGGEFYPIKTLRCIDETDDQSILDIGHPVLETE